MNIYVGNINYDLSEDELQKIFSEYGDVVSVKIIRDHETGRPKGFGFVEMEDDKAGNKAIEELNGAEVMGRPLRVNMARPQRNNN